MKIIENNGIVEIYADQGKGIRRIGTDEIFESVSLCKIDSYQNWEEVQLPDNEDTNSSIGFEEI